MTNLDSILKQRHYFANKGPSRQSYGFSSSHGWMSELDDKENQVLRNWCFWTVVLEKTLETLLDCKEIKLGNRKGNQLNIHWMDWCWSWNFNTLATWWEEPNHWKGPWCWERLKAGGDGDDRGWDGWMASLTQWTWVWANFRKWWRAGKCVCFSPWGHKESDTTEQLNNKWIGVEFSITLHDPRNATVLNGIRIFLMNYILLKRLSWFLLKEFFFVLKCFYLLF